MKSSKKSMAALLLTAALVSTGLVGCSQTADNSSTTKDTTTSTSGESNNVPFNNNTPVPTPGNSQTGQPQQSPPPQQASSPNTTDKDVQAVAKAFNIGSDYYIMTADSIVAVAMGHLQLPLTQKQNLALAKAMNDAMMGAGWKQGDPNPGLFVARDGSGFDLGMKLTSGEMTLQTYEVQTDGTFKKVKSDTKKAS